MNTPINNGGPAFPVAFIQGSDPHGADADSGNEGMTLRDWFAGQALPIVMKAADARKHSLQDIGIATYAFADSMIAARAKQ